MTAEENIVKLNIKLPEAKAPVGNYVATKICGKILFGSGQISIDENGELIDYYYSITSPTSSKIKKHLK